MRALSLINIESELSYAYLYAVASRAGMSCYNAGRHEDNNGIDANLTAWGPFENGGYLNEISMKVQLKATIEDPHDDGHNFSYFLQGVGRYDDLRSETIAVPRILVVLFLPHDPTEWLSHTPDELAMRRCAYWQSLRTAPPTTNASGMTIKLPKNQLFCPTALADLAARLSRRDFPTYPKQ